MQSHTHHWAIDCNSVYSVRNNYPLVSTQLLPQKTVAHIFKWHIQLKHMCMTGKKEADQDLSYAFGEPACFTTNKNDSTAQLYDIPLCITLSGIRKNILLVHLQTHPNACMRPGAVQGYKKLETVREAWLHNFYHLFESRVRITNSTGEAICRSEALETLL